MATQLKAGLSVRRLRDNRTGVVEQYEGGMWVVVRWDNGKDELLLSSEIKREFRVLPMAVPVDEPICGTFPSIRHIKQESEARDD